MGYSSSWGACNLPKVSGVFNAEGLEHEQWLFDALNDEGHTAGKDNAGQVDDYESSATGNYVVVVEGSIVSGAITEITIPGTCDDGPGSGGDGGFQPGNHGAAAPAADVDQQRRFEEEQRFQKAYTAAMIEHRAGVAKLNEPVPPTLEGKPFCLYCVLFRVIIPKMGQRGPLRNVALDPAQLAELRTLFNAEVAHPTLARAHSQATKGKSCPIFAPKSDHFSIPQDKTWGKLRQWHDQAKLPKKP